MGRIVCLMGKSSTGKDTVYKRLVGDGELGLKNIVPYTTRPIREGEREGREYFFTDETGYRRLKEQGKVIEDRAYRTVHGLWRYFTVNDGQMRDENQNYILIGTLEAYRMLREYFGADRILPILLEVDDGVRLQRALRRELAQEYPRYEEMCRRFLADAADFSEERIKEAGEMKRIANRDLEECVEEIRSYIKSETARN